MLPKLAQGITPLSSRQEEKVEKGKNTRYVRSEEELPEEEER